MIIYLCRFPDSEDAALNATLTASLNARQKARMAEIAKPLRARQYLYSRVMYNRLYRLCTGEIFEGDLPKNQPHPAIAGTDGRLYYTSLSHTADCVAWALSDQAKVAVDIEQMLERNFEELGCLAFDESELEKLKQANFDRHSFYRLWGLKECRYKLQADACLCHQEIVGEDAGVGIMLTVLGKANEPLSIRELTNPLNFEI